MLILRTIRRFNYFSNMQQVTSEGTRIPYYRVSRERDFRGFELRTHTEDSNANLKKHSLWT